MQKLKNYYKNRFPLTVLTLILVSLPMAVFFVNQRQGTRSQASGGQVAQVIMTQNQPQLPGKEFANDVYIDTFGNDLSAIDITLQTDNHAVFTRFEPNTHPLGSENPLQYEVLENSLNDKGTQLHYVSINPTVESIIGDGTYKIKLGTVYMVMTDQSPADIHVIAQQSNLSLAGQYTPAQIENAENSLLIVALPTPTITMPTIPPVAPTTLIAPSCTVSFQFPQETITEKTDVSITVVPQTPNTSDLLWQYSTMYEVDANGTIINNFGGCANNVCVFRGAGNTLGTHRIRFALRDAATYGDKPGIKLPGQTTDQIWCTTTGNDTFTATRFIPKGVKQTTGYSARYTVLPGKGQNGSLKIEINETATPDGSNPHYVALLVDPDNTSIPIEKRIWWLNACDNTVNDEMRHCTYHVATNPAFWWDTREYPFKKGETHVFQLVAQCDYKNVYACLQKPDAIFFNPYTYTMP